ncbi:MAG: hypothetical protein K6F77_06690 [Lachnospiraceae bacterium]|nr:hypothetical protein [Lachnospiraceae bacterium]
MLKDKKIFNVINILFFIISIFLVSCFSMKSISSAETSTSSNTSEIKKLQNRIPLKIGNDDFYALVTCNDASHVKYGRYICLKINLYNNKSKDFSGFLRVSFPGHDNKMFQKQISVKKNHNLNFDFVFPAYLQKNYFILSLVTKNNEVLVADNLGLNLIRYSEKKYIGVISDDYSNLEYLNRSDTELFYLSPSDITDDYKILDMYDCIVIGDTDTAFGDNVKTAIQQWINNGGTLCLCVPDYNANTIMSFSDNYEFYQIKYREQSLVTKTAFGLQENGINRIKEEIKNDLKEDVINDVKQFLADNLSVESYLKWSNKIAYLEDNSYIISKSGEIYNELLQKFPANQLNERLSLNLDEDEDELVSDVKFGYTKRPITTLDILNSIPLITENGENIVQYIECELGRVMFFETSIEFDEDEINRAICHKITNIIVDNISSQAKQRLRNEEYEDYSNNTNSIYSNGLNKNDTGNLPNLKFYTLILLLYIIINGPLIYYILRKRTKNMFFWLFVPVFSVVFTVLIYIFGSATRIEKPFVNYLSQMKLENNGQSVLNTYFSFVSINDSKLDINFDGNRDITPFDNYMNVSNNSVEAEDPKKCAEDYDYGIEYSAKSTSVILQSNKAFEKENFEDKTVVSDAGQVNCTIYKDANRIYGSVENVFNCDLVDCFIYNNGYVVKLGDIKQSEIIEFDYSTDDYNYIEPMNYNFDLTKLSPMLLNHTIDDKNSSYSITEMRMKALIEAYITSPQNSQGIYFYGFLNSNKNSFIENFSMKCYGVTAFSQSVDVNYLYNGSPAQLTLSSAAVSYDENLTDGVNVYSNDTQTISVTYKLPENINTLIYNADKNAEFNIYNSYFSYVFNGSVYAVDKNNGKKKVIFESGVENTVTDLSKYVDKDNLLTLYYNVEKRADVQGLKLPLILIA